jgi:hypothetical protein
MYTNEEAIKFLEEYCTFENPNKVWILKGVSRNKDQTQENTEHFMRRFVVSKPEDIGKCYIDIKRMGNQKGTLYRLYVSLNSRDVIEGMFHFQKKLLDISHGVVRGIQDIIGQTHKLSSVWKTMLEQRCCRGTKRVLLDIDTRDEDLICRIQQYLGTKDILIHFLRKTPSGYAIIIPACDMRGFDMEFNKEKREKIIDIQRDSMVFVQRWKGEEDENLK